MREEIVRRDLHYPPWCKVFRDRMKICACCSIFHDSPVPANDEEPLNWDIRHIRGRSIPIGRMGKLRKFRSPVLPRWLPVSEYEVYRVLSRREFPTNSRGIVIPEIKSPFFDRSSPLKGIRSLFNMKRPTRPICLVNKLLDNFIKQISKITNNLYCIYLLSRWLIILQIITSLWFLFVTLVISETKKITL